VIESDDTISMRSYRDLLDAHRRALNGELSFLQPSGRRVERGIWLAEGVDLHPGARLTPPVWIGRHTRIGIGAQVGPFAAIGSDSVISGRCLVEDAVVLPSSFVGENLELKGVIVDRNLLVNTRLETETVVKDPFLLGSPADHKPMRRLARFLGHCTGALKKSFNSPGK